MKPFKFSKKNREYIKWDKNTKQVRIFPKTTHTGGAAAQLQIEMDAAAAQGLYSNTAAVTHTETEFVLDFLFLMPGQYKARIGARVISTPLHTKRLGAALRENIKQYEARFGPIKP
jgi:hypothetical protein